MGTLGSAIYTADVLLYSLQDVLGSILTTDSAGSSLINHRCLQGPQTSVKCGHYWSMQNAYIYTWHLQLRLIYSSLILLLNVLLFETFPWVQSWMFHTNTVSPCTLSLSLNHCIHTTLRSSITDIWHLSLLPCWMEECNHPATAFLVSTQSPH